jgi:hypothetical protein
LTTTFDDGLSSTCRLPRFSAFDIVFKQSESADIRVMVVSGCGGTPDGKEWGRGGDHTVDLWFF